MKSMTKNKIRLIIPDSHGNHIDMAAAKALVKDCKALTPDEIVFLGDHLDCGGTFNSHQRTYTNELTESYEDDCQAANWFLDAVQFASPKAECYYLEGNHEQHVERWAARAFHSRKDAEGLLAVYGPEKALRLKDRGVRYFRRSEKYMSLSIEGTIRLGKCYFTHGISASKHASAQHLSRFGANVVFGHTHRAQSTVERTVTSDGFGAWNPGTLAKLQPLYMHTNPSSWSHGYALQFVAPSGRFVHWNVPIMGGQSLMLECVNTIRARTK